MEIKTSNNSQSPLILIVLFLCGIFLYRAGCTIVDLRPKESRIDDAPIDPKTDPVQINLPQNNAAFFIKKVDGVNALITPLADYKISGRVVSKRHYYKNWLSKLSPVDLALAWGELSSKKYDSQISYWHSDRYYSYRAKGSFEGDPRDIGTHSANEHLVPANRNLAKALKSIKKNEIVEITGQLVNIEWMDEKKGAQNYTTSLTRDDTGAGACEVIYVTRVKIKNKVFE